MKKMNRIFDKQLLLLHLVPLCFNISAFCSDSTTKSTKDKTTKNPIAYFASKKDASLIGSGEVSIDNNNELFFFGFSTGNETLARYLRPKIPLTLMQLHKEKCVDYSLSLATSMKQIMLDFYRENATIDPCDVKAQEVLLSLLHLTQNKRTLSSIQCIDGKFEPVSQTLKKPINPLRLCRFFIPIVTAGAKELHIKSPTYNLLRSNQISRETMYKRPQEMVNKILKDDTNDNLINLIYMSESQWLEKCNHPSTAKEYVTLRKKWLQLQQGYGLDCVTVNATELEKSVLSRWNHNRTELLRFAAALRVNSKTSPEAILFVDNLIELAPLAPTPAPKVTSSCIETSCFASLSALFEDNSDN